MDLVQIRYFLALARTLNFTRAAEACNVTQPALTKSIQRLEDELGGPLLLRERALTQLTALGRSVLPLLQQTYDAAQRAKDHAVDLRRSTASPLRVGFSPDAPTLPFMPIFSELAARLHGFELSLADGEADSLRDDLLHGALDVAVVAGAPGLPERLNAWGLFQDETVLMLPAGHSLPNDGSIGVASLDGMHVASRGPACAFGQLLDEAVRRGAAAPAGHHRASTPAQLADMARAGFAAVATTARMADAAGLARRRVTGLTPYEVHLVAVAGRPFSRATDAFVKLARARAWA